MRKSEYEAMLIDESGKIYDPLELDTAWKVMEALKEKGREKATRDTLESARSFRRWLIRVRVR